MSLIDIVTPSESTEGTTMKVQSWLKAVGDIVKKDDPLVEMETDKVTMEIECPVDGILKDILVQPGADVAPGDVIGRVDTDSSSSSEASSTSKDKSAVTDAPTSSQNVESGASQKSQQTHKNTTLSPSVRRFVIANNLNVEVIAGTGKNGRITLKDAKSYARKTSKPLNNVAPIKGAKKSVIPSINAPIEPRRIPHSSMRRSIAKHMSYSVNEAPHVTSVFEVDFSAIQTHRAAHKVDFAARGVKLTYTAYFLLACVEAMRAVPEVNSKWHHDAIEIFSDINIGVGTALGNKGLIVPVIRSVQERNLFGVAKSLQDMIERARTNKLKPEDVNGGTFTISNHGVSGSLIATPIIINQPQSAILGVGKLEKRVVVQSISGQDVIAIKPMAFVSLTIDHRVLDGHQTNTWLTQFISTLENWDK